MKNDIFSRLFVLSMIFFLVLATPSAFARYDAEEDVDSDDTDNVTITGRLVMPEDSLVGRIAERLNLDSTGRRALKEVSEIVDIEDYDDDDIRTMVRRRLAADRATADHATDDIDQDRPATSREVLSRWIEHLDLDGQAVRAIRKLSDIIDLEGKDETEVMTLVRRQLSSMEDDSADTDEVDQERPVDTRPDDIRPDDTQERPVDPHDRIAEARARAEEQRAQALGRIRERNAEAAQRLVTVLERSERARDVVGRLDEERALAIVSGDDDEEIENILEHPERVLRRFSPEDLADPETRRMLAERAKAQRELEESDYRARGHEASEEAIEEAHRRREEAAERARQAAERAQEKAERMRQTRDDFQASRERILECVEESTDCDDVAETAREHILSTVEYLIENVEREMASLESSEHITDEMEERVRSVLEEKIDGLEDLRERLSEAETFEEIRELGREANALSRESRSLIDESRNVRASGSVRGIVAQLTALQRRFEVLEGNLERLEISTEELSESIDEFLGHVESAEDEQLDLEDVLGEDLTGPERAQAMRDAAEHRRNAIMHVRGARDVLRDTLRLARDLSEEEGIPYGELMRNNGD